LKPIESDITDDAFKRIQNMIKGDDDSKEAAQIAKQLAKGGASLQLSTQDRFELYNEIMGQLCDNEPPHQIAQQVVGIVNAHIDKKITLIKDRLKGKSPIFRRVG